MSQKPKTTVEVLAGLVDEDVAHQHLPGWESFQIIALLPVLVLVMFLVVYTAFMAPANLYAFLAAFIASIGILMSYILGVGRLLDPVTRRERFRRIAKSREFKALDNPRNRLILLSLTLIWERIEVKLADAINLRPDLFEEDKLLQDAIES